MAPPLLPPLEPGDAELLHDARRPDDAVAQRAVAAGYPGIALVELLRDALRRPLGRLVEIVTDGFHGCGWSV